MTRAAVKSRGPVEGAVRCYRLAPASSEDAVAWVAERLRLQGFQPLDTGWKLGANDGTWIMVEIWAVPPSKGGK